ncbi:MAG: hypothetical protein ACO31W_08860 [Gemmatimonadaceae bacterium]
MRVRHWIRMLGVACVVFLTIPASAQVSSTLQTVTLGAVKGQTVTLTVPSPGSQSLTLVDGAITEWPSPITLTVSWDVTNSPTTTVKLVGYFATPAQAMTYNGSYISSALIEAQPDGSTEWLPVTSNAVGGVGTAGGSVVLYTSPVTDGGNKAGSHSVSFRLRLNLTSNPTTVAGTYSGTFNLMAIAN